MPEPTSRLENLRTLRFANIDMAFYTAFMTLAGGAFLVGFVQLLCKQAGVEPDPWIGWLSAIPSLAGVLQIPGAVWGRRSESYKRFVTPGWMLWRLFYVPIAILPFVAIAAGAKLWILAACLILSWSVVYIANPTFFDWLAELVPTKSRGWFFSRRNALGAGVGAVVGLAGGYAVDHFKGLPARGSGPTPEAIGYGLIFALAVLFALIGQAFFSRMQDLRRTHVVREKLSASIVGFRKIVFDRHFRAVLLFLVVFVFGQTFSGGFFAAYALESLRMPLLVLQIAALVQAAGNIPAAFVWGFLADKYGNKPMLALAAFGTVLTPVPWMLCAPGHPLQNYAILIPAHFVIGMIWAGVGICQFNLLLATAPEEHRANCLGVGLAIQGFVGGLAPIAGAVVMSLLRPPEGVEAIANAYKMLFVITAALRFLAVLAIAPVREEGSVRIRQALRDIGRTTPKGIRALRKLRHSSNIAGRRQALRNIASQNVALAEEEIILSLHDPSPKVRREAAAALGKLGRSDAAVSALLHMLDEHADLVEEETVDALGEIRDPRAVEPLTRFLQSRRLMVRRAAAKALGRIGSKEAVPALMVAAAQSDAPVFRRAGLQALAELGAREAEEVIAGALLDPQPVVRIAAAEAVATLGLRGAAPMLRQSLHYYDDEAESEAAYALGVVGEASDAATILREAASCQSIITRRRCLLGIARLLGVEDDSYRLLSRDEGMARDEALLEKLRGSKEAMKAFEAYAGGDEPGAVKMIHENWPDRGLEALVNNPVKESFIVAACVAMK